MSSKRDVLLIDCRSEHEIERDLVSEAQVLRAVLANRNGDGGPAISTFVSRKSFRRWFPTAPKDFRAIHIASHAWVSEDKKAVGLSFIDGWASWQTIAYKLVRLVPALSPSSQRILTLSCCYAGTAAENLGPLLSGHFSLIYYLSKANGKELLDFDLAATVWSMFYLRKNLAADLHMGRKTRTAINAFLKAEQLQDRLKKRSVARP